MVKMFEVIWYDWVAEVVVEEEELLILLAEKVVVVNWRQEVKEAE